jgi:rsbT co-antagonist protein RsbR
VNLAQLISRHESAILQRWVAEQAQTRTGQLMSTAEIERESRSILQALAKPNADGTISNDATDSLSTLSRSRAIQGFTPAETAMFVFSLKTAVLPSLQAEVNDSRQLTKEVLDMNREVDALGLSTFEAFVSGREEVIRQQSAAIADMSTPVVQIWDGVLLLPIVGVIDTERSQQMMEAMLSKIVATGSSVVLIDITGVAVVDTAVARHLLQTIQSARLLGAEAIVCGISARVAQTIVHLGVDLPDVTTCATLARGLKQALSMAGSSDGADKVDKVV